MVFYLTPRFYRVVAGRPPPGIEEKQRRKFDKQKSLNRQLREGDGRKISFSVGNRSCLQEREWLKIDESYTCVSLFTLKIFYALTLTK